MRTTVVTGSASGMGFATRALLEGRGETVIGVDRHDAEVVVDLASPAGRASLVDQVTDVAGGRVDAIVACAGLSYEASDPASIVAVNYFGAVATLDGLRGLLARGVEPRAVVVASVAALSDPDSDLTEACLTGDEARATALSGSDARAAYMASKRAIARWVRRVAPLEGWAGAGIPLNVVAPALVRTPMSAFVTGSSDAMTEHDKRLPQPLRAMAEPIHIASLLCWLVSADNAFVTGQMLIADGGFEVLTRGDTLPRVV